MGFGIFWFVEKAELEAPFRLVMEEKNGNVSIGFFFLPPLPRFPRPHLGLLAKAKTKSQTRKTSQRRFFRDTFRLRTFMALFFYSFHFFHSLSFSIENTSKISIKLARLAVSSTFLRL